MISPQWKRLLVYVRPYGVRLTIGVCLVAFVALAEGAVALMVRLAIDYVLTPSSPSSQLPLLSLPGGRVIYLNQFFTPSHFHNVWSIFSISLLVIFVSKGIAEYLGTTQIQYVGHAATTDLRNRVFAKILRQPIGFFQHHQPGGFVVGNQRHRKTRSRCRNTSPIFSRIHVDRVSPVDGAPQLEDGSVCAVVLPLVVYRLASSVVRFAVPVRIAKHDWANSADHSKATSGNRVAKAFGMEDFEARNFAMPRDLAAENMRWVRAAAATRL